MSTQLLEKPITEDVSERRYCHATCDCSPRLTLCGAYKPVLCGIKYLDSVGTTHCPVCKKEYCPECDEQIELECPRCGL